MLCRPRMVFTAGSLVLLRIGVLTHPPLSVANTASAPLSASGLGSDLRSRFIQPVEPGPQVGFGPARFMNLNPNIGSSSGPNLVCQVCKPDHSQSNLGCQSLGGTCVSSSQNGLVNHGGFSSVSQKDTNTQHEPPKDMKCTSLGMEYTMGTNTWYVLSLSQQSDLVLCLILIYCLIQTYPDLSTTHL